MKLEEYHIKELYHIIKKNGVKYYDVQTELVDHFAIALEEENEKSFDEKTKEILEGFDGKKGLKQITTEKRKVLLRKFFRIYTDGLKNYFSFPKILLTICIFIGFVFIFRAFDVEQSIYGFFQQLFNMLFIFQGSYNSNRYLKNIQEKGYSFLTVKILDYLQIIIAIPIITFSVIITFFKEYDNVLVLSGILSFSVIAILAYAKLKKHLVNEVISSYPMIKV
ncbi:hypothetical protein [Aquimarina litoralis]|uniref:hypothetical protein n=1 Tax=Aquimarina litoralis TaxID=584605 RepID=UPI001C56A131|nr:hypothetical protein [Aquimarina litoralis]MBW1293932.1 hypothetical protein [Aquimarina litoralis]